MVTNGYKWLQMVTNGYKWLQTVTNQSQACIQMPAQTWLQHPRPPPYSLPMQSMVKLLDSTGIFLNHILPGRAEVKSWHPDCIPGLLHVVPSKYMLVLKPIDSRMSLEREKEIYFTFTCNILFSSVTNLTDYKFSQEKEQSEERMRRVIIYVVKPRFSMGSLMVLQWFTRD